MNAFMKLTAAALGAASIAGGVAVAQDTSSKDPYANPDTVNYGTPPGAPLKRDGSLHADPKAPVVTDSAATDSSTTTTTTTSTTWNNPPAAAPAAPVADTSTTTADAAPAVDTTPAPRPDRN
jgi:hypothetical protein